VTQYVKKAELIFKIFGLSGIPAIHSPFLFLCI